MKSLLDYSQSKPSVSSTATVMQSLGFHALSVQEIENDFVEINKVNNESIDANISTNYEPSLPITSETTRSTASKYVSVKEKEPKKVALKGSKKEKKNVHSKTFKDTSNQENGSDSEDSIRTEDILPSRYPVKPRKTCRVVHAQNNKFLLHTNVIDNTMNKQKNVFSPSNTSSQLILTSIDQNQVNETFQFFRNVKSKYPELWQLHEEYETHQLKAHGYTISVQDQKQHFHHTVMKEQNRYLKIFQGCLLRAIQMKFSFNQRNAYFSDMCLFSLNQIKEKSDTLQNEVHRLNSWIKQQQQQKKKQQQELTSSSNREYLKNSTASSTTTASSASTASDTTTSTTSDMMEMIPFVQSTLRIQLHVYNNTSTNDIHDSEIHHLIIYVGEGVQTPYGLGNIRNIRPIQQKLMIQLQFGGMLYCTLTEFIKWSYFDPKIRKMGIKSTIHKKRSIDEQNQDIPMNDLINNHKDKDIDDTDDSNGILKSKRIKKEKSSQKYDDHSMKEVEKEVEVEEVAVPLKTRHTSSENNYKNISSKSSGKNNGSKTSSRNTPHAEAILQQIDPLDSQSLANIHHSYTLKSKTTAAAGAAVAKGYGSGGIELDGRHTKITTTPSVLFALTSNDMMMELVGRLPLAVHVNTLVPTHCNDRENEVVNQVLNRSEPNSKDINPNIINGIGSTPTLTITPLIKDEVELAEEQGSFDASTESVDDDEEQDECCAMKKQEGEIVADSTPVIAMNIQSSHIDEKQSVQSNNGSNVIGNKNSNYDSKAYNNINNMKSVTTSSSGSSSHNHNTNTASSSNSSTLSNIQLLEKRLKQLRAQVHELDTQQLQHFQHIYKGQQRIGQLTVSTAWLRARTATRRLSSSYDTTSATTTTSSSSSSSNKTYENIECKVDDTQDGIDRKHSTTPLINNNHDSINRESINRSAADEMLNNIASAHSLTEVTINNSATSRSRVSADMRLFQAQLQSQAQKLLSSSSSSLKPWIGSDDSGIESFMTSNDNNNSATTNHNNNNNNSNNNSSAPLNNRSKRRRSNNDDGATDTSSSSSSVGRMNDNNSNNNSSNNNNPKTSSIAKVSPTIKPTTKDDQQPQQQVESSSSSSGKSNNSDTSTTTSTCVKDNNGNHDGNNSFIDTAAAAVLSTVNTTANKSKRVRAV